MPKREIIYRSKSLNGIFYYTKSEESEFDKINEMSPCGLRRILSSNHRKKWLKSL